MLAIAVTILLLSGLALYVAFRVRETLRDEKGRGAKTAKVAFLVGLLFLSGGMFYFFASGFNPQGGALSTTTSSSSSSPSTFTSLTSPPSSTTTTSTVYVTSSPTSTTTSTASTGTTTPVVTTSTTLTTTATTATTSTSTSSTSTTASQGVSMPTPQCPTQVPAGQTFQCTIYIYNVGSTTYFSGSLTASGTFYQFTLDSCSESMNGAPASPLSVSGHSVDMVEIAPGTMVLTLTVTAPSQPGAYANNVLTLSAPGISQPISDTFSIQVTH